MSPTLGGATQAGSLVTRLSGRRRLYGLAVAVVVPVALTAVLVPIRERLGLDTVLLLFVLVSVAASVLGGIASALVASAVSFGLANFYFTRPYGSLLVASKAELVDLVIFGAVAFLVGIVTEVGARARERIEGARLEAEWITELGNREQGPHTVDVALSEARALFGMNEARLVQGGRTLVTSGEREPADVVITVPAGDDLQLEMSGPERMGEDRNLLGSLAMTAGRLWRTQQLSEQARRAEELARIDELRASLLAAVGHDLRNPLATITAAASTLREPDLHLGAEEQAELLATIEEHAGRLNAVIGNLLDASRLQAGVLSLHIEPTALLEVLMGIVLLGEDRVELAIPEDLPLVKADPGLLERVLANLVNNADRHLPPGEKVRVEAEQLGRRVAVRVIDHGPGVEPERFDEIFAPFQHFSDRGSSGVGLGLAIARGFTEAMGGSVTPSPTPGGGLTMTVSLEVAGGAPADR